MFSVIYIPSNLAVFFIYLLTLSCNVCYEGELYFVLSDDIRQSFHDNYEKAYMDKSINMSTVDSCLEFKRL